MFKKFILAALVAAPMMLSAQSAVKFGMVNPAEIFQVMPETATAQNTLKAASDKYQQQGKALQDERSSRPLHSSAKLLTNCSTRPPKATGNFDGSNPTKTPKRYPSSRC